MRRRIVAVCAAIVVLLCLFFIPDAIKTDKGQESVNVSQESTEEQKGSSSNITEEKEPENSTGFVPLEIEEDLEIETEKGYEESGG